MRKRNHSDFISWFQTEQEVFVGIEVLDAFHEQCQNTIQIISHSINVTERGARKQGMPFLIFNEQWASPRLKIIIKNMYVIALVPNFKPNFQSYHCLVKTNLKQVKRKA